MSDLKARPKANFIEETDWQKRYVLTNHWKSDLLFYMDDLKFLHNLIEKYFIWITKKNNLKEVQQVGNHILKDAKQCRFLLEKTEKHLSHLANLIDEPFKNDSSQIGDDHQELEESIALFAKTIRKNKKQLFSVTERVLDDEQLVQLMKK